MEFNLQTVKTFLDRCENLAVDMIEVGSKTYELECRSLTERSVVRAPLGELSVSEELRNFLCGRNQVMIEKSDEIVVTSRFEVYCNYAQILVGFENGYIPKFDRGKIVFSELKVGDDKSVDCLSVVDSFHQEYLHYNQMCLPFLDDFDREFEDEFAPLKRVFLQNRIKYEGPVGDPSPFSPKLETTKIIHQCGLLGVVGGVYRGALTKERFYYLVRLQKGWCILQIDCKMFGNVSIEL